jgi:hypothetical protein
MTEITGSFVSIDESNITTSKTSVQQLIDIVQADISSDTGSATRKKYQVFVSGGTNLASITSSLYQSVFDQDFTLGTSNPLFDVTIGSYLDNTDANNVTVNSIAASFDSQNKLVFKNADDSNNNSLSMMREKVSIYRQFAQDLLGNPDASFSTPHGATSVNDHADYKVIHAPIFITFRRLFTRDNLYKGSFGMKLYKSASSLKTTDRETNIDVSADIDNGGGVDNYSTYLIDDSLVSSNLSVDPIGGEISTLRDDQNNFVGLIYYDKGVLVLDSESIFDSDQIIRGIINTTTQTISGTHATQVAGSVISSSPAFNLTIPFNSGETVFENKFYPNLWVSGTIDQVVDHVCDSRFGTGTLSSIAFRNETIINSSLIFCRAAPSQLNYSSNPTYKKDNGEILGLDSGEPFTFVTTVGLYDAEGFLLAVAKTSRPIEKNTETDLSIRIRLDY